MNTSWACRFTEEPLAVLLEDGLEDLVHAHWDEAEVHKDKLPLAVDWAYYKSLQDAGAYQVLAVRSRSTLVGYNSFFVNCHTRSIDTVHAVNDGLYLVPECRRGRTGVNLIRYADALVRRAGASTITYGVNLTVQIGAQRHTVGDLLFCLGYNKVGEIYSRVL